MTGLSVVEDKKGPGPALSFSSPPSFSPSRLTSKLASSPPSKMRTTASAGAAAERGVGAEEEEAVGCACGATASPGGAGSWTPARMGRPAWATPARDAVMAVAASSIVTSSAPKAATAAPKAATAAPARPSAAPTRARAARCSAAAASSPVWAASSSTATAAASPRPPRPPRSPPTRTHTRSTAAS